MTRFAVKLPRLGRAWAAALDRTLPTLDVEGSRDRLLASLEARTQARRAKVWPWALGAAAALVLLVGTVVGLVGRTPRSTAALETGAWIMTKSGETFPLEFSEGSRILLEPESRAQVISVDPRGAKLVLLRGGIKANIVHRPDTAWAFAAGPFAVTVTGTELRVSWEPTGERFEVSVDRGSVAVTGPLLEQGRSIHAGQRCRVNVRESKLELTPAVAKAAPEPVTAPSAWDISALPSLPSGIASPKRQPRRHPSAQAVTADRGPSSSPHEPSWRELERQGRFREAVEAAERTGLDKIYGLGSSEDLMTLARAARLAEHGDIAHRALLKFRERFAEDPQAAKAAFLLGRSAPPAEAAEWFATYLREQPGGPLAREAAGRLIEAYHEARDPAAAKDAARKYLASYPAGPHAAFARQVLREPSGR
jgi:transmembrane sensor